MGALPGGQSQETWVRTVRNLVYKAGKRWFGESKRASCARKAPDT